MGKLTAKQELAQVLDPERVEAVIEHRAKAIRVKLTPRAAKLLAGQFARCADPNAAADHMILHGWRGFNADWVPHLLPKVVQNGVGAFDLHLWPGKPASRPEPSAEERERNKHRFAEIAARVGRGVSMHKPHRVQ